MGPTVKPKAPRLWYVCVFLTLLGLTLMANFESSADRAYMTEDDLVPIDFPVFYVGGRIALQKGAQPLYYPPAGVGNADNHSLPGLMDALYAPGCVVSSQCAVPAGLCLFYKICGVAVILVFLFWCWKKSKDASGVVDELILLPLVYLLVAPFAWGHHFLLAVFPLTYLWARSRGATDVEMVTLSLSTLALGTALPNYMAASSPWARPLLTVLAIALWPAATSAVIWVAMRMYVRSRELDKQPLAVSVGST